MWAYQQKNKLHSALRERWLQLKALMGALFLYALIIFFLIVPSHRKNVTTVIIDPHCAPKPVLFLSRGKHGKGSGKINSVAGKKNVVAQKTKQKETKKKAAQQKQKPQKKVKEQKKIEPEKKTGKKIIEPVEKKIIEQKIIDEPLKKPEPAQIPEQPKQEQKEELKQEEIPEIEEVAISDEQALGRLEKAHYALSRAVARVWKQPRVAVKKPVRILVTVNGEGKAENVFVEEQSGVPAYDIAARAAVLRTEFPQEFFGKQIALVFGIT